MSAPGLIEPFRPGVLPAITTPFRDDDAIDQIDHRALAQLVERMLGAGCTGVVAPGSLGEGSSLSFEEKRELWATCVRAAGPGRSVVAAIASASTREGCDLARTARDVGCSGLMVLPPYVYRGDWPETRAHIAAILEATALPAMLYNNPPAYGVDIGASQVAELAAQYPQVQAVKDSSGDVRRFAALRNACGERIRLFVGLDDCLVEGIRMGADGWVAGLVNALPEESVRLYDLACAERTGGDRAATDALYRWFLPLLRLDTGPKFVQLIKLVQNETETGGERVRPPRRALTGAERAAAIGVIRSALATRPRIEPR